MHEGPRASDVSNRPGPTLKNVKAQYFHVLQKGGDFSGMCPTFAFINDSTMATLSFGRATTTLLLLDVKDTISVLDQVRVPGRGSSAFELAGKKGRGKIFTNTAGGAYSYISGKDRVYIPGANNNILRGTIKDRMFEDVVESIDLSAQVEAGNLIDPELSVKEQLNQLTALLPDVEGNLWFTSRQGVIGVIERDENLPKGCPKVYYTFIGYFGLEEKLRTYYPHALDDIDSFKDFQEVDSISPEVRKFARETLNNDDHAKEDTFVVANTFGFTDSFNINPTPGGIMKFEYNQTSETFEPVEGWPKSGVYDCKTATLKLSTSL